MNTAELVKALQDFALEHYDAGGHWIYECWVDPDYLEVLYKCKGDLEEAKLAVRSAWELICSREKDAAWDGPDMSLE